MCLSYAQGMERVAQGHAFVMLATVGFIFNAAPSLYELRMFNQVDLVARKKCAPQSMLGLAALGVITADLLNVLALETAIARLGFVGLKLH